ncbi:Deleted in azoospermia-like, partial [Galemys pyrenaicus]
GAGHAVTHWLRQLRRAPAPCAGANSASPAATPQSACAPQPRRPPRLTALFEFSYLTFFTVPHPSRAWAPAAPPSGVTSAASALPRAPSARTASCRHHGIRPAGRGLLRGGGRGGLPGAAYQAQAADQEGREAGWGRGVASGPRPPADHVQGRGLHSSCPNSREAGWRVFAAPPSSMWGAGTPPRGCFPCGKEAPEVVSARWRRASGLGPRARMPPSVLFLRSSLLSGGPSFLRKGIPSLTGWGQGGVGGPWRSAVNPETPNSTISREAGTQSSSASTSQGYVLPEGKIMPNTVFVGGIDVRMDETEIRSFFARYGSVKEVKIITDRTGVSKGYGFVSFYNDVDVQKIVESQINFHGKKLKLGPAIRKQNLCAYHVQPRPLVFNPPPPPQFQSVWNNPNTETYMQPPTVVNPITQYVQAYPPYPSSPVQVITGYQLPIYNYQMPPQWPAGEQRSYVIPPLLTTTVMKLIQELMFCQMTALFMKLLHPLETAHKRQTSNFKSVDRSIQTVVSCLFNPENRLRNSLVNQDDYFKILPYSANSMGNESTQESGLAPERKGCTSESLGVGARSEKRSPRTSRSRKAKGSRPGWAVVGPRGLCTAQRFLACSLDKWQARQERVGENVDMVVSDPGKHCGGKGK